MELNDRLQQDRIEIEGNEPLRCGLEELPPADIYDPVIEVYKKDVDRTLLIENLRLTPEERSQKFTDFMKFLAGIRQAGEQMRNEP